MENRKKFFTTKNIAGLGILCALVIVLQLLANYIQFGPVSITLALVPIVVGALFYGPLGGLFLGLVNGVIVIFAPSTLSFFWPYSQVGTIVTCLVKTSVAGLVSGLIFLPFKNKKPKLGVVLTSVLCPIVNTGLFVGFVFIFFYGLVSQYAGAQTVIGYVMLTMIGVNFIIEFALNAVLSLGLYSLYKHFWYRLEQGN